MEMSYWCESCARKSNCYTIRSRPKCFMPITNSERIAEQTEPMIYPQVDGITPSVIQTKPSLEQFRVGLEYHTDATHFGKAKGESITTDKTEQTEPQTDCAWK